MSIIALERIAILLRRSHICRALLFIIFSDGLPLSLEVVCIWVEENHQGHASVGDVGPLSWGWVASMRPWEGESFRPVLDTQDEMNRYTLDRQTET